MLSDITSQGVSALHCVFQFYSNLCIFVYFVYTFARCQRAHPSRGRRSAIVEADDVSGFKLESPWAVAVADNGKVWFSNFGAPFGSVDWVGSVSSGSAKEEYGINDVSDLQIMHVKALAAGEGDDLYLAAYGGPTASAIVKCSGTCRVLATISTGNYLPTAVAFSSTMKRVFYALADGALEKSRIYSVAVDGDIDRVLYVEQDDDVGVAFPVGLAVDDVNQHLYWSNDAGPDQIQRGPLAKEYSASGADKIGTVLSGKTTSARPHSLALDVVGRKIYFTDQTSATHQIGRVDYDGENLETLKELGNNTPHGLAL